MIRNLLQFRIVLAAKMLAFGSEGYRPVRGRQYTNQFKRVKLSYCSQKRPEIRSRWRNRDTETLSSLFVMPEGRQQSLALISQTLNRINRLEKLSRLEQSENADRRLNENRYGQSVLTLLGDGEHANQSSKGYQSREDVNADNYPKCNGSIIHEKR